MTQIVNHDNKLTFILTQKGLDAVAEALDDHEKSIVLTKIKVGTGRDYEYYEPSEGDYKLEGEVEGWEFPLIEKRLLEDDETICLMAVIPETFEGYDIREVGLYMNKDGKDELFAISTQQPFVKPLIEDNYIISINYYMFLRSSTLASIYDQIILDPDDEIATEQDLEELMRTILFAQANLMHQIGWNAEVIGFNRPTQLYNLIERNHQSSISSITYSNFTDLLTLASYSDIFGYWIYNYPNSQETSVAITDLGKKGNNMNLDQEVNLYPQEDIGNMSFLKFEDGHYYNLSMDAPLVLLNSEKDRDIPFTMIFCVEPLQYVSDRTLLARSNLSIGMSTFEVQERKDGRIRIRLYTNKDNYLTFEFGINVVPHEPHVLAFSYNPETRKVIVMIDGLEVLMVKTETGTYIHMNDSPGNIYGYVGHQIETVYVKDLSHLNERFHADGTVNDSSRWSSAGATMKYNNNVAPRDTERDTTTDLLYCWQYGNNASIRIYTKETELSENTILYNSDYTIYSGTAFKVTNEFTGDDTYQVIYNSAQGDVPISLNPTGNITSVPLYAFTYEGATDNIWANSPEYPNVLYSGNGDEYYGRDWKYN